MENIRLSVSDFIALTNQTLEYAYPSVTVEGEVASFKVNQGKYVFFDLKDAGGSVGCFMTVWQLRVPIEDGMKVVVDATPKLTQWGKFSLTVRAVRPSGEGALKKSFELLRAKLEAEGLFNEARKRPLPTFPTHIGVISSTQAAGYADFIKIVNDRWGGVRIDVAHTQVQGAAAAEQIERAIAYFNERDELPEVLVIVRGGGSADDLAVFNEEPLVRAVAASRIPVLTGIGHEVDASLVDMAADVRAATPSNAAQLLVPDRQEVVRSLQRQVVGVAGRLEAAIAREQDRLRMLLAAAFEATERQTERLHDTLAAMERTLRQLDPARVLARGYAIVRGERAVGSVIQIEEDTSILTARIEAYDSKK